MKQKLCLIVIGFVLVALTPFQALALSAADRNAILNGTEYYDPSSTGACLGGPAGSGPLYGPAFPQISDTATLATNIQNYIKDQVPESPLIPFASDMVSLGQQYNVNPGLLLGVADKESSLATTGSGPPPVYNFWGDLGGPGGSAVVFSSYPASIEEYYKNLRTNSAYAAVWAEGGAATIDQLIDIATPPSDPRNHTAAYIVVVKQIMQKILTGLGTSAADVSPIASTNACGQTINSAGAFGWDLPPSAHAMVFYSQADPRWANDPYGAGKDSILNSGCGPTSLAMVGATLTGNTNITPLTVANQYGAQYHGDGTDWSLMPVFAKDNNLKFQALGTDLDAAAQIIQQGGLVVISVDPGFFTKDGHIMVIRAVTPDGTGFYLANPGRLSQNDSTDTTAYSADFLRGQGAMKQLWGYLPQ